jgi:pimeloyl-ACP methyl ester carboxylesterase
LIFSAPALGGIFGGVLRVVRLTVRGGRVALATIVLVHGAMHGGWCWKRVVPRLRRAGHEVVAPTLTGLGERAHLAHPGVDLDTHVADVVNVLAYEDLTGAVLVGHSYGAVVATGVADRLPERVAHLVFLDGAMAGDGQAALDFFPPDRRAAWRALVEAEGEGWRLPPPADLTGWGITAEEVAAWVRGRLVAQPFRTFTQPLRLADGAGFGGPKTFVACLEAPPAGWRDAMAERARAERGWRYRELAAGHDAMITAPSELADLLLEVAQTAPGGAADAGAAGPGQPSPGGGLGGATNSEPDSRARRSRSAWGAWANASMARSGPAGTKAASTRAGSVPTVRATWTVPRGTKTNAPAAASTVRPPTSKRTRPSRT